MSMPRIAGTGVDAAPQNGCMIIEAIIAINNPSETVN
jgi:hypothetical protein